mmetsp:Transcript_15954/g.24703  ORF Transcript_15954/g.24703 Transcript_15954/m.24703 type:complete len:264 (+) Transcript_15954:1086-1877(+)
MQNWVSVIQYIEIQPNARSFGRGSRGINIDLKEFLALKNLVHFYSPDPFLGQKKPVKVAKVEKEEGETKPPAEVFGPFTPSPAATAHLDDAQNCNIYKSHNLFIKISQKAVEMDKGLSLIVSERSMKTMRAKKVYQELTEVWSDGVRDFEKVLDWDKRIQDYPDRIKRVYDQTFGRVAELKRVRDDTKLNWAVYMENKKEKTICHLATSENNLDLMRLSTEFDHSPEVVGRAYLNVNNRYKYDPLCSKMVAVECIGANLITAY